jgi:hypothetical protein
VDNKVNPGVRKDGKPFKADNTLPDGDYIVGRGRPPEHTRFSSGDGRKRGSRGKGQKNFDSDWEEELTKPVIVIENGKRKRVTAHHAQVKRAMDRGGKGDHRAQQTIFEKADRLLSKPPKGPRLDDRDLILQWLAQEQMGVLPGIVGDDAPFDEVLPTIDEEVGRHGEG